MASTDNKQMKSPKAQASKKDKVVEDDPVPEEENEEEEDLDLELDDEEELEDDDEFDDDYDDDEDGMDEEDEDLSEVLVNLFTTEEGVSMADVSQEVSEHLANITKLLSNTNKILIKMLSK